MPRHPKRYAPVAGNETMSKEIANGHFLNDIIAENNYTLDAIKLFLKEAKPSKDCHSFSVGYALHYAVIHDDIHLVQTLMDAGHAVDSLNSYGMTPLSLYLNTTMSGGSKIKRTPAKNHQHMYRLLITENTNINQADQYGQTPLMHAIIGNCHPLIPNLLKDGADMHRKDAKNKSALDYLQAADQNTKNAFKKFFNDQEKERLQTTKKAIEQGMTTQIPLPRKKAVFKGRDK